MTRPWFVALLLIVRAGIAGPAPDQAPLASQPATVPATVTRQRRAPLYVLDLDSAAVTTEPSVPAGLPILFWVSLPNRTAEAHTFWLEGPGRYPDAGCFAIDITRVEGGARIIGTLGNGQWTSGRATAVTVEPGASLTVPLCTAPLAPGSYHARITWAEGLRPYVGQATLDFVVTGNADATKQWTARRVDEMHGGDPFAVYVCVTYGVAEAIQPLFNELVSDDTSAVTRAARTLGLYYPYRRAPEAWLTAIDAALAKHTEAAATAPTPGALGDSLGAALAHLAWKQPRAENVSHVVRLSRSEDFYARDAAIMALQSFHQPEATERLAEVAETADASHRLLAAEALLNRGDERGVSVLAAASVAEDAHRSGGRHEFEVLAMYPDNAAARAAVAAGLASLDPAIRRSAELAINGHPPFLDPLMRQPLPDWIASMTTPDAAEILLRAEQFALLDQKTAADPPPAVIAYRRLARSTGATAIAHHLLRAGTPAGRMYGLSIAYFGEMQAFRRMVDQALAEGGEVTVVDTDGSRVVPVREVVNHITTGEWPQRLGRPYVGSRAAAVPTTHRMP
jgi:hypothetical protein